MTDDQKRWHAAEAALNQAWERLADHNSPTNQALAWAHLHHNGDAAPMVELLASDDPLHPATRVVLAQWLLDQHRKGKITRAKRGNPNQRHSRQFSIGDLGTFILHPDNPGEMVAARVRERMGVNAAISWVVERLNRLDPNGNPVISEETVKRSYRDFKRFEKSKQESDAIRTQLRGSDKRWE